MGYFSNGSEGDDYQNKYCSRCQHLDEDGGCPVFDAHLLYNYPALDEGQEKLRGVLNMLIPRGEDGLGNEQCKMFMESEAKGE